MAKNFALGSIIIGVHNTIYGTTNKDCTMKVIDIDEDYIDDMESGESICVEILDHKDNDFRWSIGHEYWVNPKYFREFDSLDISENYVEESSSNAFKAKVEAPKKLSTSELIALGII